MMKERGSIVTLCEDVQALIASYEAEAEALQENVWVGRIDELSGYRALGRAAVLHEVASHLRGLVHRSTLLMELMQALKDLVGCVEKSEVDEENEAEAIRVILRARRRKRQKAAQREKLLRAVGRAVAYAEIAVQVNALIDDWSVSLPAVQDYSDALMTLVPERDYPNPRALYNADLPCPLFPSFPPLPKTLVAYQRELLNQLEQSLLAGGASVLLKVPHTRSNLDLLFASLDRLLRFPFVRRILVIDGSRSHSIHLHSTTYRPVEDGLVFAGLYRVQDLSVPLAEGTRVCISSIRQVQVCLSSVVESGEQTQNSCSALSPESFDVVVVYGYPPLSPLWCRVLTHFRALVIWMSFTPTPELEALVP